MLHYFFIFIEAVLEHYKKCPSCKRIQVVQRNKKGKSVSCKFCGAEILSPKRKY